MDGNSTAIPDPNPQPAAQTPALTREAPIAMANASAHATARKGAEAGAMLHQAVAYFFEQIQQRPPEKTPRSINYGFYLAQKIVSLNGMIQELMRSAQARHERQR